MADGHGTPETGITGGLELVHHVEALIPILTFQRIDGFNMFQ